MTTRRSSFISAIILMFLFFSLFISSPAVCQQKNTDKLGYIDLLKVFDGYSKTKEFEENLGRKEKEKSGERRKIVDEIRRLKDELELLTDKVKRDKQNLIDEKIKKLQNFDIATRDELTKQRDDMLRDILKEIDGVVSEYAKKEEYLFIFNSRFLIYGDETIDITDEIIKLLNK